MIGGLGPWIPQVKIYMGIPAGRKVASMKQFIKGKAHPQGMRVLAGSEVEQTSVLDLDIIGYVWAGRS